MSALACSPSACVAAPRPSDSDARVVPTRGWDERIVAFQFRRLVTAFAVISDRYVVLIDTLVNRAAATVMLDTVRPALRSARQLLVVNTHMHYDHCGGNTAFTEPDALHPAPVLGHRLCRERVSSPDVQAELADMQRRDSRTFVDVRLEPPTLTYEGPLAIHGGDLTLQVIPTPGHAPEHVAVFVPEIRTLFPGDAAEAPLPFIHDAATLPQLRASLECLQALEPTTVLYSHVPGRHNPDVLSANIAYFDEVERRAAAALAAGRVLANPEEAADLEALIEYPFEQVPLVDVLEPEEQEFYRGGHRAAIRAMLAHLGQAGY
jgi:glyoxylase-like metal-dependent hydrolase (beta-lactamase superfamily II)